MSRKLTEEEIIDLNAVFDAIQSEWHIHPYPEDADVWAEGNMEFALTILRRLDDLQETMLFADALWSISHDLAHHAGFLSYVDYLQVWDWLSKF